MIRTSAARAANAARNVLAPADRRERWRPARDRLWTLLERHVEAGIALDTEPDLLGLWDEVIESSLGPMKYDVRCARS